MQPLRNDATRIPGEEEAFIDMKQDRFDGKAELDLEGAINKLRLTGAYNDYTHTEFEAPRRARHGVQPGRVRAALLPPIMSSAAAGAARLGLQYVDVDFEAIGEEAFVPSSKTQTMSVFAFEERHFDQLDDRARCARRAAEDRRPRRPTRLRRDCRQLVGRRGVGLRGRSRARAEPHAHAAQPAGGRAVRQRPAHRRATLRNRRCRTWIRKHR